MKVRITKCFMGSWWYANRIGEVFEVSEGDDQSDFGDYVLVIDPDITKHEDCGILEEDCEEV